MSLDERRLLLDRPCARRPSRRGSGTPIDASPRTLPARGIQPPAGGEFVVFRPRYVAVLNGGAAVAGSVVAALVGAGTVIDVIGTIRPATIAPSLGAVQIV